MGAGAAGVAAAGTLSKMNITDFVVLDAQPFVGGRVQHVQFGNYHVELGANWIYGKGENPIYRLAMQHGLKTAPSDKSNVTFFNHHGTVSSHIGKPIYEAFEKVMKDLVDYAGQRMRQNRVDLSGRAALSLLGWRPDTPLKAAVEYFAVDWELAEPAEVSSLDYATGTIDMVAGSYPAGNEFVIDDRGFNYILQQESKKFLKHNDSRLMLDTRITDIFYDDQNVTVVTDNGHRIVADYAICTFSLGVLQNDDVKFHPPFPEWKREALLSFHMTTYTKIFLRFDTKFWGDWQNLNAPGYLDNLEYILMVTTTYKESERIERMADAGVQHEIMQVLRRMFGPSVPEPSEILIPRWHSNPLFRGSYSNWPIGAFGKHHQNMRAPLGNIPRLWFAGEATSEEQYGFFHGAWLEGISIAKKVTDCLQRKCPQHLYDEFVTGCEGNSSMRWGNTVRFYNQAGM
ncbi:hypothetical protein DFQ28_007059 [Apophysomyces sp. BC1034]|nr:hypothetical protein DFQ29_005850 [Apophysomyces sp. BC1021]KAG0186969.1 hypothetical protein DFQ28_007059 [Apophysomyces sp. BC1034]